MKDATKGYRDSVHRRADGGRVACIHGDLCRDVFSRYRVIKSRNCPYDCQYYEPKEKVR